MVWRTLLKLAAYGAFYTLALVLAVYWTFPWDKARERLERLASARLGKKVEVAEVAPWRLTGLELRGVAIHLADPAEEARDKADEAAKLITSDPASAEGLAGEADEAGKGEGAKDGEEAAKKPRRTPPLRVERLAARLSVLSLVLGTVEAALQAEALGGELSGTVSLDRDTGTKAADLELAGLELGAFPVWKDWLGVAVTGRLSGKVDVTLDGEDFTASKGEVTLTGEDLRLGKGAVPLPKGSMFPQFDLESPTDLGQLDVGLRLGEGTSPDPRAALAELTRFEQKGADLAVKASGSVALKEKLGLSRVNVDLEIKPAEAFVKRNSLGLIVNNPRLKRHQKDGWFGVRLAGTVSKPQPRLQRPGSGRKAKPKRPRKGRKGRKPKKGPKAKG